MFPLLAPSDTTLRGTPRKEILWPIKRSVIARAKFAKDALSAVGLRTSIFVGSGVNLYTDIIRQTGIRQNTRKLY